MNIELHKGDLVFAQVLGETPSLHAWCMLIEDPVPNYDQPAHVRILNMRLLNNPHPTIDLRTVGSVARVLHVREET